NGVSHSIAAEINNNLRPFPRNKLQAFHWDRFIQESTIRSNLVETSVIRQMKLVVAGIGSIKETQPDFFILNVYLRVNGAVYNQGIPISSVRTISSRIIELIIFIEEAVLDDNRKIIDAIFLRNRQRV